MLLLLLRGSMPTTLERIIEYLKKEKIATAQELAQKLDVNIKTIRYWIRKGIKERKLEYYPSAIFSKRGMKVIWGVMLPITFKEYLRDLKKITKHKKV